VAGWSYTSGKPKRVGFVHAIANIAASSLYAVALAARSKGNRSAGPTLSALGYSVMTVSVWLGGELVARFGLGVNHTAFQSGPATGCELSFAARLQGGRAEARQAE
jgi:hypothetical protein